MKKFKDIGTNSIKLIFLYLLDIIYNENIPKDIIEYIKGLEDFKDDV
jgi:hypothetical protein